MGPARGMRELGSRSPPSALALPRRQSLAQQPPHRAVWGDEAAKLLAPPLHAAALTGEPISQVIRWLETEDRTAPIEILESEGDATAQSQLEGVVSLDSRNAGTTYMSTAHLLAAYR
jgi:type IV secretion system protein VirD4